MKTRMKTLLALMFVFAAVAASHAQLLFVDDFDYANGCIETDGVWFVSETYTAGVTNFDALVNNDLLILNQTNNDSVGAPFTNTEAPSVVYASFNINVSTLPTAKGGFFCVLNDGTNADDVAHIFIDTQNTVVPGTYQIGVGNVATSITTSGATNFPMDLATDVTYQVVFSWDEVSGLGATLWINPSSENDVNVYASDVPTTTYLKTEPVSEIELSQYPNQGVAAIGDVMVGVNFTDVMTNVAQLPVIGVQPQGNTGTLYTGDNYSLYTAASGMDVTYQWYSNNVQMVDDGVTVVGSQSNVLNLTNLQISANYNVVATDGAGSVTSTVAMVSIITTPTQPYFTLQPQGETNSLDSPVTLTALANGTGPITYQWWFEPAGGSIFSQVQGATSSTYSLTAGYGNSGSYYLAATGGAGGANSETVSVLVIPPPLVSIAYMHTLLTNANANITLNGGQVFEVQGVVTTIGNILSTGTSEFFVQDGTGGCLVYAGGFNPTNAPPVGALVNVISPAECYYGELEMDPTTTSAANTVTILSTNNPLPAPILMAGTNYQAFATNCLNPFGSNVECSLGTLTNIYIYGTTTGGAVSGNFPTNSSKELYGFQYPYSAGQPYFQIYVYTYTNALNRLNTNYWGKPIPSHVFELTGALGVYAPTTARFYPSRYADFVTNVPAAFPASVALTNGVPTISWPALVGSTYSIYSATNLLGPWTQTFGLSYYPSTGTYTDTNAAAGAEFYRISTP
jgi:hypothetical protein